MKEKKQYAKIILSRKGIRDGSSKDTVLKNEIGKIFRGHNILEYKSPDDVMNVDTYYKTLAYAYLYKAGGEKEDEIQADDITISMVRERKPLKLFRYLEENKYVIDYPYSGIYYVQKEGFPQTQIIVSTELDRESHRWLTALTRSMESEEARKLVLDIRALKEKDEKEYADSVFDVTLKENRQLFETLKKEGESMCEALAELMRPELEQAVKKAKEEAEKETEKAKKEAEQAKAEAIKAECITERERRRADAAESEVLYLREEIRRLKENGNSRE